jgi:hypothetical protein
VSAEAAQNLLRIEGDPLLPACLPFKLSPSLAFDHDVGLLHEESLKPLDSKTAIPCPN